MRGMRLGDSASDDPAAYTGPPELARPTRPPRIRDRGTLETSNGIGWTG
jgi:hypothetical protein